MPPPLSAGLFTLPLERGRYLVYAPLRRTACIANARAVNVLADLQAGRHDPEEDPGGGLLPFLRRLQLLDARPDAPPLTTFQGPPEPTTLTLFLTTACNLRCTYCYASAGDTPKKFMDLAVAQRGISFVAENAARRNTGQFAVAYHGGGEPTLNWRTLTQSLAYAREQADRLGLTVTAGAASNGVLNDTQIDWIIANLAGVSLSCDGLPSVHDRHRPLANGKGSSGRIAHTLRRFDAAGFRYGLRLTVTRDDIPQLADSIAFLCREFQPQRIQVEPVYQLGRGQDAASAESDDFIAAYRAAQAQARRHGHALTYSAARLDTLANHFCAVSQDNFCLSPDGNVSACYEAFAEDGATAETFFYGAPDPNGPGYRFDAARLERLRRQAVQHRPYCQGCFAKWHCAGDCYHKALAAHGPEFNGTARCHITRELIKDQLIERIAEAGGLFWHDPHPPAETARTGPPKTTHPS